MGPSVSILEGPYLGDILAQPQALEDTIGGLSAVPAELAAVLERLAPGHLSHLVLTGMGSSFHALYPLHLALVEAGLPCVMVETSELVHYQRRRLGPGALVVAVSQSGRSAEILRLLEARQGSAVVAVTNTPRSLLAERADATVLTRAGEEATVSCKTYLATQAALLWLSGILTGKTAEAARESLAPAPALVSTYLALWREHVAGLAELLEGTRDLFLAGRGPSLSAAGAGGLILKESTHLHAEGMSGAAFRHGPLEMVGPEALVLVFSGETRTRELNHRLVEDVRSAGGRAERLGEDAEHPGLRLPAGPPELRPVLELLPVEMVSLALAARDGREAGCFAIASKVTTSE